MNKSQKIFVVILGIIAFQTITGLIWNDLIKPYLLIDITVAFLMFLMFGIWAIWTLLGD